MGPRGALVVAPFAQILDLLPEIGDSALIILLGPGIKHLARIAQSADADGCTAKQGGFVRCVHIGSARAGAVQKIQRMKFLGRMLQQSLNVAETLDVLERETGVVVTDRPIFAVTHEHCEARCGNRLRPGKATTVN
ncbi:MAG: hypothetical protein WBY93_10400 [Candidatus Binatus sp.]